MRPLIRFIDRQLRHRMEVFEYSDRPDCLFRARILEAPEPLPVPDGEIAAGTRVLELHFWNEHMPPLPAHGPSLGWAARGARLVKHSLQDLAGRLESDARFAGVEAIGGSNLLFTTGMGRATDRAFERMGFALSEPPPAGRWQEVGEKIHACMLMWAYNQASLREARWRRMRRGRFWTTRQRFLDQHRPRRQPDGDAEP